MKAFFTKAKALLIAFWSIPLVSRALHTFWQAIVSYLIVAALAPHASLDVKLTLMGAIGAGLSAVKTMTVAYIQGLKG